MTDHGEGSLAVACLSFASVNSTVLWGPWSLALTILNLKYPRCFYLDFGYKCGSEN
jgi:hypothetical protein